eukprot:gnl/MRDRNA2_/MRDRNA2_126416_c0_seq1.p1 gnl/MRDRNA2_/MRDRNA2_126416_c0~~gnl/MRDRNA2_/MRDRNA2_126416_c0_seq1.p1  ORF type:complete len:117 (-),score=23.96 gnl/MRDRNA2_/MRDRNA2_126416_c0_seq1:65-415(-)
MHAFCISIPFGMMLMCGGLMGYLKKGSLPSLAAGTGLGGIISSLGYLGLQKYQNGESDEKEVQGCFFMSALLASMMVMRQMKEGKTSVHLLMMSLAACGFYAYKMAYPSVNAFHSR